MPTDDELRAYLREVSPIYRDILSAFPEAEPQRKVGYGLAFQTLALHFSDHGKQHGWGEVKQACEQLADAGFVEIRHGFFVHPTPLGERAINQLTGHSAPVEQVPALPKPKW